MKLNELIQNNNWLSIELTLLQLYPDQEENIEEYKKVYSSLKDMKPVSSEFSIVIDLVRYDEEPEDAYTEYTIDVAGILSDDIDEKTGIFARYAIETEFWNIWLGMTITKETIEGFTELEIIAHCLYEMTFLGYTEAEIQKEANEFNKIIEDFNALSEEEKEWRLSSLEDWHNGYEEE